MFFVKIFFQVDLALLSEIIIGRALKQIRQVVFVLNFLSILHILTIWNVLNVLHTLKGRPDLGQLVDCGRYLMESLLLVL